MTRDAAGEVAAFAGCAASVRPQVIAAFKIVSGAVFLALYELLLDGSGVGMGARWSRLKGWSEK